MNIIFRILYSPSDASRSLRNCAACARHSHLPILVKRTLRTYSILSHVAFAVTGSVRRSATSRLGQLTIRTDTRLCVHAPEVTIARGGLGTHTDKHSLPSQTLAEVRVINVKGFHFVVHFAPPAAAMIARFTATRAS